MNGDLQPRAAGRGDLVPVLMRDREDDEIDLLGFHSRALVGRYKPVRPVQPAQIVFHAISALLITFAFGYLCWHIGRSYERHHDESAEAR